MAQTDNTMISYLDILPPPPLKPPYSDTGLTHRTKRTVLFLAILLFIAACNSGSNSGSSNNEPTSAPSVPSLSASFNDNAIILNWHPISSASYYEIFRNTSNDASSATPIASHTSGTSYTDSSADQDTIYYYWLQACNDIGCSDFSHNDIGIIPQQPLNDTGLTFGGNYESGNNSDCSGRDTTLNPSVTLSPQDCHQGRDVTYNDPSDGHAGFSFTRLNADGTDHNGNNYSEQPWSCVRDNVTALVWEVKTDDDGTHDKDNTYKWGGITAIGQLHSDRQGPYYDASSDASSDAWDPLVNDSNSNELCGYSNWRVPTMEELLSITDLQGPDTDYFPNRAHGKYWSASPVAASSAFSWFIIIGSVGSYNLEPRNNQYPVFLVAGGTPAYSMEYTAAPPVDDQVVQSYIPNQWPDSRYTVLDNGIVIDRITGLLWKQCPEGLSGSGCHTGTAQGLNWKEALAAADSSTFAGYDDWRVPNAKELASLVAWDRHNPSINNTIFPTNTPAGLSSSLTDFDSVYWSIVRSPGGTSSASRKNADFLRLVRGGQ